MRRRQNLSPRRDPLLPERVDAILEPYRDDAAAAIPDEDIALRAGVSAKQVRAWRLRIGLDKPRGRPTKLHRLLFYATDFLDQVAARAFSVSGRVFEPPTSYVRH